MTKNHPKTLPNVLPSLAACALALTLLTGCLGAPTLNGAGATFAFPILSLYGSEYHAETGVQVNYNPTGSGGGIRLHSDKTVQFAASEAPLNAEQEVSAPGTLTLPFVIGSVTAAYNLPGVTDLRLTGEILADIYLGRISHWNDGAIRDVNPGVNLPDQRITAVHRSDGSGTTFVWSDYLSKMSPDFASAVGKGTSVSWPQSCNCVGGNGNDGVAGSIRNQAHSIGYIELSYATSQNIPTASIRNQQGEFVKPTLQAGTVAATGAVADLPPSHESWTTVSFTDAPGPGAYPVSSFSYFLIYEDLGVLGIDRGTAQHLLDWIAWSITTGQQYNEQVHNARIPQSVQERNLEGLARVNWNGEPLEVRYAL